ncbi:MAG: hypothetical protein ACTSPV_19850 [Candidatus Hodarchaeales archaeon]
MDYEKGATPSYSSENSVSDEYRYVGWFRSQKSGFFEFISYDHRFCAVLRLQTDNDQVRKWAHGVYGMYGNYETVTKYTQIKVKFEYRVLEKQGIFWLLMCKGYQCIGDDVGSGDGKFFISTGSA